MVAFAPQQKQAKMHSQLQVELPVRYQTLELKTDQRVGLVVVDEVNGFCTVGDGNLAPRSPDLQIANMVSETAKIAKQFSDRGMPIIAFLDTHEADKPEPPYPPHCIRGSGEELLVPELAWLENDKNALLMPKDCISGFIGAFQEDGSNIVVDWISEHQIEMIVVVGICTDICVLDFVSAIISAKNHGMTRPLQDVVVYSNACSTFDLPLHCAEEIGAAAHPQTLTHHVGLYFAQMRGAMIVDGVRFLSERWS